MKGIMNTITIMILITAAIGFARAEGNLFISVGGVYSISDFKQKVIEDIDIDFNFDDGMGMNAKAGYFITDYLALGVSVDILRGYDWNLTESIPLEYRKGEGSLDILQGILTAKAEFDFVTAVAFARLSLPGKVRPYITAGLGYIRQNAAIAYSTAIKNGEFEDLGVTEGDYRTENDPCAKGGAGIELRPIDKYAIGLEATYTAGFGDTEDIRFVNITLFGSIYF